VLLKQRGCVENLQPVNVESLKHRLRGGRIGLSAELGLMCSCCVVRAGLVILIPSGLSLLGSISWWLLIIRQWYRGSDLWVGSGPVVR
jgi:hypothetical protein